MWYIKIEYQKISKNVKPWKRMEKRMGKKENTKKRVLQKELLYWILLGGGIVVLSMLAPQLPYELLKSYLRHRSKLKAKLLKLEKRGWIRIVQKGDDWEVRLVKDGKLVAQKYQVDKLKIKKPKKWDRIWRVVVFDIPENKKQAREILRDKLKNLGFYKLQKSVFVHPYPCREEIEVIKNAYELWPYVSLLEAKTFDSQDKLEEYFTDLI